jgi:3-hydroxyisobutyrate dehydrogenase
VLCGAHGLTSTGKAPQIVVDSTSIVLEESADIRTKPAEQGVQFLAAPVSGNAHVIKAGKLTVVASGPLLSILGVLYWGMPLHTVI